MCTQEQLKYNRICVCAFHSLSQVYSVTIISTVWWTADKFPFKRDKYHFPTSRADI